MIIKCIYIYNIIISKLFVGVCVIVLSSLPRPTSVRKVPAERIQQGKPIAMRIAVMFKEVGD